LAYEQKHARDEAWTHADIAVSITINLKGRRNEQAKELIIRLRDTRPQLTEQSWNTVDTDEDDIESDL
jgi:hypothetical protein